MPLSQAGRQLGASLVTRNEGNFTWPDGLVADGGCGVDVRAVGFNMDSSQRVGTEMRRENDQDQTLDAILYRGTRTWVCSGTLMVEME